jgi:hypothetical protein
VLLLIVINNLSVQRQVDKLYLKFLLGILFPAWKKVVNKKIQYRLGTIILVHQLEDYKKIILARDLLVTLNLNRMEELEEELPIP